MSDNKENRLGLKNAFLLKFVGLIIMGALIIVFTGLIGAGQGGAGVGLAGAFIVSLPLFIMGLLSYYFFTVAKKFHEDM